MAVDLFAGLPVTDYELSLTWYERLLGAPAFFPNEVEAVWEIGEHRYLYIDVRPEHDGHAMHTLFVDDLDAWVRRLDDKGRAPTERENYDNVDRKVT